MISIIIAGGKLNKDFIQNLKKQTEYIKDSEIILVTEKNIKISDILTLKVSKDHGFAKMGMFGALFSKNQYIIFFRDTENISIDYLEKSIERITKKIFAVTYTSNLAKRLLINPSGTLFKKSIFFKLGGFSPKIINAILSSLPLYYKILKNNISTEESEELIIKQKYKKCHDFFYNSDLTKLKLKYSKKTKIRLYSDIARKIFTEKNTAFEKLGILYGIIR